jgi:acetyl esterase/lipase
MTGFLLTLSLLAAADPAPREELLWPNGAPGAKGTDAADKPTLTIFAGTPDHATEAGVVICPGGGYRGLAIEHEGKQIAKWLNDRGIAAFMLKYRHAPKYNHPAPMQDVQRALRTVRARAKEWNLDPQRIGIWGFSAGGHLASTAATHFDDGKPDAEDAIERASCRPDFAILCYPVITMTEEHTHPGSRNNLLGPNPDFKLVTLMSNEKQVTPKTPPTFLFHTTDDAVVPAENALLFYAACRRAGVVVEMHIYEKGRHGVGLAADDPVLATWTQRLEDWLKTRGVMKK